MQQGGFIVLTFVVDNFQGLGDSRSRDVAAIVGEIGDELKDREFWLIFFLGQKDGVANLVYEPDFIM